jgi:hypothetical protein
VNPSEDDTVDWLTLADQLFPVDVLAAHDRAQM